MKFTIGNTLNEGFRLLSQYFSRVVIAGALLYILPATLAVIALYAGYGFNLQDPEMMMQEGAFGFFGVYMLVIIIASLLCLSVMTHIVVKGEAREPFDLGASIGRGFVNIIPLIVIGFISTLLTTVGLILLIVPGVIVMLGLYVSTLVYIAEPGVGIIGALKRSWDLTKNHRWQIFLILLIIGVLGALAGAAIGLPFALLAGALSPVVAVAFQMVLSGVTSVVSFVFVIAIYMCLRRAKDSHTPDTVANVFS